MVVEVSNADTLLFAIPMIGIMFAGLFRLDEAFSRTGKPYENGHQLSGWDADGAPVCVEPDGKLHRQKLRTQR